MRTNSGRQWETGFTRGYEIVEQKFAISEVDSEHWDLLRTSAGATLQE